MHGFIQEVLVLPACISLRQIHTCVALKRAANRFQLKTGEHHGGLEVHVHVLAAIEARCMTRFTCKTKLNTIYSMHRQTNSKRTRYTLTGPLPVARE